MIDVISPLARLPYPGIPRCPDPPVLRTFTAREDDDGKLIRRNFKPQTHAWWGWLDHLTGTGCAKLAILWTKQKKMGRAVWTALDVALYVYQQPWQNVAHYLTAFDGTRYALVSEHLIAPHCGVKAWQREACLDGDWRAHTPNKYEEHWDRKFPGVKSPAHLHPYVSNNEAYKGNEWLMLLENDPTTGTPFTPEQYESSAELAVNDAGRYGYPLSGVGRRVSHEDVAPMERSDSGGGWDRGQLRDKPTHDDVRYQREIDKAQMAALRVTVVMPPAPPPADPFDSLSDTALPKPAARVVALAVTGTPDQHADYARAGYHASLAAGRKAAGAAREAWAQAALAYLGAAGVAPLGSAWALLCHADRLATIARQTP